MTLYIGCSLGATNVQIARVAASGDLHGTIDIAWSQIKSCKTAQDLADLIATKVKEITGGGHVDLFGLAIKGPLSFRNGKAEVGPWANAPFQKATGFQEMLEQALHKHGVRYAVFMALLDAEAALRGELHLRGTLAGLSSGMVVIWGTGRGVKIYEKGVILPEIGKDEAGEDRWRVVSSIGRGNVYIPEAPNSYRYEYRGIPFGHTRAPLAPGEVHYSARTAGPWLARRISGDILQLPEGKRDLVLREMEAQQVDIRSVAYSQKRNLKDETGILSGLTTAALNSNPWARQWIASIGAEEGSALAAFAWEFRELEAVRNIVLVSTIAERLGRGVGPGDLLIDCVRDTMRTSLVQRGMEEALARNVATGVRRSVLGRERELLPFAPGVEPG